MPEDNNQNIEIAEIKKDIDYLKKDISAIKTQVFNHIPTKLEELNQDFQKYKLSNAKWLIGILISLLFVLVGLVINLLK